MAGRTRVYDDVPQWPDRYYTNYPRGKNVGPSAFAFLLAWTFMIAALFLLTFASIQSPW